MSSSILAKHFTKSAHKEDESNYGRTKKRGKALYPCRCFASFAGNFSVCVVVVAKSTASGQPRLLCVRMEVFGGLQGGCTTAVIRSSHGRRSKSARAHEFVSTWIKEDPTESAKPIATENQCEMIEHFVVCCAISLAGRTVKRAESGDLHQHNTTQHNTPSTTDRSDANGFVLMEMCVVVICDQPVRCGAGVSFSPSEQQ